MKFFSITTKVHTTIYLNLIRKPNELYLKFHLGMFMTHE